MFPTTLKRIFSEQETLLAFRLIVVITVVVVTKKFLMLSEMTTMVGGTHLVFQLLAKSQSHSKQHENFIQPWNGAFSLRWLELHGSLIICQLVRGEDELVTLNVKAQRQIFGKVRWQAFHVPALHQLIDGLFLGNNQACSATLKCIQYVRQDVKDFIRRLKVVVRVNIVDVVDGLLKVICSILDLLNLPWEVLSYWSSLYHILLTLHFEAYVLDERNVNKTNIA